MAHTISRLFEKYRQGSLGMAVRDRFLKYGFEYIPYYLFVSFPIDIPGTLKSTDYSAYRFHRLGPEHLDELAQVRSDRKVGRAYLAGLLTDPDVRCFGLRKEGFLACFNWYHISRIHSRFRNQPLTGEEAYSFDAYTDKDHRGKKLSIYLRILGMQRLSQEGKTRFLSIVETFNRPALKSMDTLGSRKLEHCVYLKLFNRWRFHWKRANFS